ncbi:hypothetical protein SAMN05216228_102353 [Rhizobium tibeticum]|uniref:Uncharacterized protein n=1 Tax=Rhizobium tibeticum TaxID=501024 RepID=A0A1H8S4P8_9HYPH|nr:hypothetical protein RTCCBAU85039_4570 [Rhizobium tibeticum]SEO73384.1 hypothetical protein SAMN05216228_102353 [Rhizobium tibeticum]
MDYDLELAIIQRFDTHYDLRAQPSAFVESFLDRT